MMIGRGTKQWWDSEEGRKCRQERALLWEDAVKDAVGDGDVLFGAAMSTDSTDASSSSDSDELLESLLSFSDAVSLGSDSSASSRSAGSPCGISRCAVAPG